MRAAFKFATVLLLVLSLGAHWALLQTVAWTGMMISYSQAGSFKEALSKTFDGEHPCCLCKAIAAGKKSEQKPEALQLKLKIEFPLLAKDFLLVAPKTYKEFQPEQFFAPAFPSKPPLPPPRLLPA